MTRKTKGRRRRDPDATRARLLAAGFDEVYQCGFQAASVDDILSRLSVTKGAYFHHLANQTDVSRGQPARPSCIEPAFLDTAHSHGRTAECSPRADC
jgi:hypothetical protein